MTNPYNDKTMIVSDTIYHNIECCLRNMVCEDDEAKKQMPDPASMLKDALKKTVEPFAGADAMQKAIKEYGKGII